MRAPRRAVGYLVPVSWLTATVYDYTLHSAERACLGGWRSELLGPLHGNVLELGAGTGLNLERYPEDISSVTLVEPDPAMRHRLKRAVSHSALRLRAHVIEASAESLSFDSGSFDAVVGTLVLCSVSSVEQTLAEAKRVLRPGGTLALIEHVSAPQQTNRHQWQKWLAPAWSGLADGCQLLRDPRCAIESAGFETVRISEREMKGVPWFIKPAIVGTWVLR